MELRQLRKLINVRNKLIEMYHRLNLDVCGFIVFRKCTACVYGKGKQQSTWINLGPFQKWKWTKWKTKTIYVSKYHYITSYSCQLVNCAYNRPMNRLTIKTTQYFIFKKRTELLCNFKSMLMTKSFKNLSLKMGQQICLIITSHVEFFCEQHGLNHGRFVIIHASGFNTLKPNDAYMRQ